MTARSRIPTCTPDRCDVITADQLANTPPGSRSGPGWRSPDPFAANRSTCPIAASGTESKSSPRV